eukprot:TRINITY_DN3698_c0_g1_i1.p1 TRINITY_DN3698_c0_g1~~TRINITY_DN3698_c0_g1_i1.p1  ORF type:complete len:807 (-),score=170.17 TRINITY_DN3698_c0_g1_i1:81-2501(-)
MGVRAVREESEDTRDDGRGDAAFLLKTNNKEATGKIVSQIINSSEFVGGSISIVDFETLLRKDWLPKSCFDLANVFKESLPQVQVHTEEAKHQHQFAKHDFNSPRWCDHCFKFIWGLSKQGVKCKVCGYSAHRKCSNNVPLYSCVGKKLSKRDWETLRKMKKSPELLISQDQVASAYSVQEVNHELEKVFLTNPTWCDICMNFIWGVTTKQAFKCKNCNFTIHKKCCPTDKGLSGCTALLTNEPRLLNASSQSTPTKASAFRKLLAPDLKKSSDNLEEAQTNGSRSSEKASATSYLLGNAVASKRDGNSNSKMFEQFLIVGADTSVEGDFDYGNMESEQEFPPKFVFQYPKDASISFDLNLVLNFCFPEGLQVKGVDRKDEAFDNLVYTPISRAEQIANSFVFVITGDEIYYGVCVYNKEFVRCEPSLIPSQLQSSANRLIELYAPRCYCFISRYPFFHMLHDVLYSILARERVHIISNIDNPNVKARDSHQFELLEALYAMTTPSFGERITFTLPGDYLQLEYSVPTAEDPYLISLWCMEFLTEKLSIGSIVQLLNALLLEKSVVVVGQHYHTLTASVLAVIGLLRPWIWQGTLVTILPHNLKDIIDSPVPYVVGVTSLSEDEMQRCNQSVILYVDIDKLVPPQGGFPKLPRYKHLYDSLKSKFTKLKSSTPDDLAVEKLSGSRIVGRAKTEELLCILDELYCYNENLLENLKRMWKSSIDFEDRTQVKELTEAIPPKYQAFYSKLFETQLFQFYAVEIVGLSNSTAGRRIGDRERMSRRDVEMQKQKVDALVVRQIRLRSYTHA